MSTIPVPYDELSPGPYSVYPTVDLTKALYPEVSPKGLGRRGLVPYCSFAVERWPDLSLGDYLGLRIGDLTQPIASTNIKVDEERYFLYVDAETIGEGDLEYFARVLRTGSEQESRSVTEKMLFKQTIPGGHDRRPEEPWHSGLIMWLADLTEGSILNPDTIAGGLRCMVQPYLNIRKNDKISLFVDGILHTHIVSPQEATNKKPIEVRVPEETLRKISPLGPVGVVFTVEDVVGNVPEGKYLFSKPIPLLSEMDTTLLPFPLVLANDEVVSQLDLDTQSTATLAVEVSLDYRRPTPNPLHKVTVIVETTDKNGVTETVRLPAVNDRNRRSETIPLPNSLVTTLAGGRFRVSFELATAGGALLGRSSSTLVYVVGTPTLMPALNLIPYEAGHVPTDTDVTAQLPTYSPHDPKYLETVICEQVDAGGGGERVTFLQLAGPQGGTRQLPKAALKVFEGLGIGQAFYETNDGKGTPGSIRQSEKLNFEIGDRVEELTPMFVPDAESGNIDPAKVIGDEWLMYVTYSDTIAGDTVHWSVIGKDARSSTTGTIEVTSATAGEVLTTLGIGVGSDILMQNIDGSLRITYSVVRPGQPPTVMRAEVLDITVGLPVELDLLKILEADMTDNTLAPRHAINGVTLRISYKSMRKDDQIAYKWNGEYDVSRFEGVTAGVPTTNSVDVLIPSEVIAKGIRQGGNNITIECELKRGQFIYTFATLYLRLLPLAVLPTPYVRGFENTTMLPISLLGQAPRIDIPVWIFMLVDQPMWLTVTGTFDDDTPYTEELYTANKVIADDLVKGVSLPLPLDKVRRLKDASLFEMRLWVSLPGIPNKQTATLFGVAHYIIEQLPAVLPYPTLNGVSSTAQEVTVDPLDIQNATSVTIKYPGMLATDSITLSYIFQNGSVLNKATAGQASGAVVVDFTADKVLHNSVNSRVQLKYSIVRAGKVTPSNVQTVIIKAIASASLPRALINNLAHGAALTLKDFSGDAKASVIAWPLIKAGQTVYLSLVAGGRELRVLDGYTVSALEATNGIVGKALSRDWLAWVVHDSTLEVRLSVGFDGSKDLASVVPFPTTNYKMRSLPDVTDFQDGTLNGWRVESAGIGGAIIGAAGSRVWSHNTSSGVNQYAGFVLMKRIHTIPGHRYKISAAVRQFNVGTKTPKLRVTVRYSSSPTVTVSSGNWVIISHTAVVDVENSFFSLTSAEAAWNGNDYQVAWLKIEKV
ncbi:hypothetical protein [Pseudomonas sp. EYE_354]|uniref:hypothetical protein n=1 Tax=Pseudomonas sp. EYE_354 TaxID=2853449 RepID=UPI002005A976|nr:hypothetical protein [Pseudomonas sp. EYE_354]MCK6188402.1 hypothetical protein [Pseudomonas sp. EYE_354]